MPGYRKNEVDIANINRDFLAGRLIVDPSYQRRKVWNDVDKVRLIETIIMNYVVPEVFFWHVERDVETGLATTHIVDGQQRIAAIVDFINGDYPLTKRFLLDSTIAETYGDLYFSDLTEDVKKRIWGYQLTVVTLDDSCNIEAIKNMFYRLNLTNYNLNPQERRHSKDSVFGDKCAALADSEFWNSVKVFSPKDYKRMLDVEFCATIYILANEFIINQTDNKIIEAYYDDYASEFDSDSALLKKITDAMTIIEKLIDSETLAFISKKVQIYSLFSIAMEMSTLGKTFSDEVKLRFIRFCSVYTKFKNEYVYESNIDRFKVVYDKIKQYKLASSEGVNKVKNRMIRFDILWDILFSEVFDDEAFLDIETFFIEERKRKKFNPPEEDSDE